MIYLNYISVSLTKQKQRASPKSGRKSSFLQYREYVTGRRCHDLNSLSEAVWYVKCGEKIPRRKCFWKYFDRHLPVCALCWFYTQLPAMYIYICNKFKGDRIRRTQRIPASQASGYSTKNFAPDQIICTNNLATSTYTLCPCLPLSILNSVRSKINLDRKSYAVWISYFSFMDSVECWLSTFLKP